MQCYKNMQELFDKAPVEIWEHIASIERGNAVPPDEPFEEYYGGDLCLVQNLEDLTKIATAMEDPRDLSRHLSLAETASVFDCCRWIENETYVEVLMCWTDAGGPTYYIPRHLALISPTVLESIKLSHEEWNDKTD